MLQQEEVCVKQMVQHVKMGRKKKPNKATTRTQECLDNLTDRFEKKQITLTAYVEGLSLLVATKMWRRRTWRFGYFFCTCGFVFNQIVLGYVRSYDLLIWKTTFYTVSIIFHVILLSAKLIGETFVDELSCRRSVLSTKCSVEERISSRRTRFQADWIDFSRGLYSIFIHTNGFHGEQIDRC